MSSVVMPLFSVDGEPADELCRGLVRLQTEAALHSRATMQAAFATERALGVGTAIVVTMGADPRRVVFEGQITAMEFLFEEGAPSVVVSAEGATPASSPPQQSDTRRILVRGREMLTAHVRVQKARVFVTVTAVTTGSPDIMPGKIVRLEQIGTSFSGDGYHVTKVSHTFDHDNGFRSAFEAQRPI